MSAAVLARRRLPEPGEMIASYEVIAPVAQGGMAEVFLVRRSGLGGFERRLAMKVMHPHLAGDSSFVNMFLDEARIASCVDHPNVVKVLDVGSHDGLPWLVMEWLDGKSLADVLTHPTRLSIGLRANVLAEVAAGLHAAHEARGPDGQPLGVVHRDVSPQNVHVGYDGVVKLVDFGIAAARGRLTRTETGQVKGKVGYLAPEQLLYPSESVDRRVDVWAFGVMAWETLAVRRLFGGTDPGSKMYQIIHAPVPTLAEVAPDVPDEIATLVMKCLERDPERRPATMGEIARTLKSAASDPHALEQIAAHMSSCFEAQRRALEAQFESLRMSGASSGERENAGQEESSTRVEFAGALARRAKEEKTRRTNEKAPQRAPKPPRPSEEEDDAAPPARAPRSATWIVLGGLALVLASGSFAWWRFGSDALAEPVPAPAAPAPPTSVVVAAAPIAPPSEAPEPPPPAPPEPIAAPPIAPRTIEVTVDRSITAVVVDGAEHDERPLHIVLADDGTAHVEARGRDGRRVTRTLDSDDDGSTLELPRRRRTSSGSGSGSLWESPY
jgi:serine/threonine protein kinase